MDLRNNKKKIVINIFLVFLMIVEACFICCCDECNANYYYDRKGGVWKSEEPFIVFDFIHSYGEMTIGDINYKVELGWSYNAVDATIFCLASSKESELKFGDTIWKADTVCKGDELTLTITKDNLTENGSWVGKKIVLTFAEGEKIEEEYFYEKVGGRWVSDSPNIVMHSPYFFGELTCGETTYEVRFEISYDATEMIVIYSRSISLNESKFNIYDVLLKGTTECIEGELKYTITEDNLTEDNSWLNKEIIFHFVPND